MGKAVLVLLCFLGVPALFVAGYYYCSLSGLAGRNICGWGAGSSSQTDYLNSQSVALLKQSAKDGFPRSRQFTIQLESFPSRISGDELDGACLVDLNLARSYAAEPSMEEGQSGSLEMPKECKRFAMITPPDLGEELNDLYSRSASLVANQARDLICLTSHVSGREFRQERRGIWTKSLALATMEREITQEKLYARIEANVSKTVLPDRWHSLRELKEAGGAISIKNFASIACDGYQYLLMDLQVSLD